MSVVVPSRAQSEVFSASQYGGGAHPTALSASGADRRRYSVNYFIVPAFILQVIGLACLWALFYYLRFTDVFPFHRRVFYCLDINLWMPNFAPREFNLYISEWVLYIVSFLLPPIVIIIGEIMFWLFSTKPRKTIYATCKECKIHLFTRRVARFISVFMFGALIVCIFIDSIKLITGYQRPYFLTLCGPELTKCTAPGQHSPTPSPHRVCQTQDQDLELRYAWLTFPSLYAGLSSFSMVFASCYVYFMINLRGAPLLRPFLIFGFLGFSMMASFSRIQGYKNHWVDVWVGWLIGFFVALFLCYAVLCFQEVYTIREERPPIVEERISPFFSWFRLPRVRAPSIREPSVYDEEPLPPAARHKRDQNKMYEVTTTTESFHRTISPPSGGGGYTNGINY